MYKKLKIVAIIPARGGSKSIPRKNLQLLGNIPLIAWPIRLAKSIKEIDRVIVSSEDEEILSIARKFGAEVPFIRPKNLAKDNTPTLPVLQHAVRYLQQHEAYYPDIILLLYSTTPFMRKERVLEGIHLLAKKTIESVVGVKKVRGLVWKYSQSDKRYKQFYPKKRINRQFMRHLYEEAGNIYFTKSSVLLEQKQIVNEKKCAFIEVGDDETVDIDYPKDLENARMMLKSKIVPKKEVV